eukprot:comp9380_c0_seq1/m.4432 comp9380_c0_seq1/g.4432  ORF comp9380_c0_seq1/g.4432 comp9380_c0_seq1/m.4432 type:complete len:291 (-) comp9380_c0_seq1:454-1326(-)
MSANGDMTYDIEVVGLTYSYTGHKDVLKNVHLKVPKGSRTLLVGANGTGKSTLMRIIAGKNLVRQPVLALGVSAYHQTPPGLTFLGSEWANNPIVRGDISVNQLMKSNCGDKYPERRDELLDLLDVDPQWHMHQVSDGERRRVQLLLGLIEPFELLLLDEVTVDLDVMVRRDLLAYLKRETETRNVTILYATHIFDGIGDWATHVTHLSNGTVKVMDRLENVAELQEFRAQHLRGTYGDSPLLRLVELWLREEFEERKRIRKLHMQEPQTELERKKWDRKYGDKFYNYWN